MAGRNVPDRNEVIFGPASRDLDYEVEQLRQEVEKDISISQVETESKVAEIAATVSVPSTGGGDIITNITQVEGSISERADIDTFDALTNTGTATAVTSGSITYTNGTGTVLYPGDEVVVLLLTDQTWLVLAVISRFSANPLPTPGNPTYPYTPVTGFPQDLSADPFGPYPASATATTGRWGDIYCGVDVAGNLGFGSDTIATQRSVAPLNVVAMISAGGGAITFLSAPDTVTEGCFVWQDELWITDSSGSFLYRWKPGIGWVTVSGAGGGRTNFVFGPQTIGGNTYVFLIPSDTTAVGIQRVDLGVTTPTRSNLTITVSGTAITACMIGNGYIWVRMGANWYRQSLTAATSYTTGWSAAVPAPAGRAFGIDTAGNLMFLNRQGIPATWTIRALSVTGIVYEVPQVFSLNGLPSEGEPVSSSTSGAGIFGAFSNLTEGLSLIAMPAGPNLWVIPYLVSMKYLEPGRVNPTVDTVAAAVNYATTAIGTISTALGYHKWSAPISTLPDVVRSTILGVRSAIGTDGYYAAAVQVVSSGPAINWCTLYPL